MHVMYERLATVDEYLAHQLVEVRCRQLSEGMHPNVSTADP